MRYRGFLLFVFAFLVFSRLGSAQEVITVDETTLSQHVDYHVAPVYPPIAKAARIQGTIVFQIQVDTTGKIESIKFVSGPLMLQQAAIDCLKQWTYHPFEKDGKPVEATGPVSIEFSLGKDGPTPKEEEIANRYFPLSDQCRKAVSAKTDYPAAAAVCKQAAALAEQLTHEDSFVTRRSAFVWAAWACMYNGDLKSALSYAEKAVDVVKLGYDDSAGSTAAYGVKGIIEGNLGDLKSADRDLSLAEDFGRKGIVWIEKEAPSLREEYRRPLVQDLRFHAQVLQQLNRPEEAQKKLDEAAKYK
jgi:TonB family protein